MSQPIESRKHHSYVYQPQLTEEEAFMSLLRCEPNLDIDTVYQAGLHFIKLEEDLANGHSIPRYFRDNMLSLKLNIQARWNEFTEDKKEKLDSLSPDNFKPDPIITYGLSLTETIEIPSSGRIRRRDEAGRP